MKTIAVFGGNGRTGLEILRQALDKGYKVKALVRNTASFNIQHERLEVLRGTPMKKEDVEMTIKGADTVFVALNIARTADNPWAKVKSPPDLLKVSMTHIVESMKKHGVSRVLTVSAWGAGDSYREANWMFRFLINKTNVGVAYKGHEEQEEVRAELDSRPTCGLDQLPGIQTNPCQHRREQKAKDGYFEERRCPVHA